MGEGPLHRVPLLEGPGALQSVKVFTRLVRGESEPLTLWARHCVFLGVVEHLRSVTHLVNGFVGEGSSLGMIFIVSIMNLLHYLLGLLGSEASQVWVRVKFGVRFLV